MEGTKDYVSVKEWATEPDVSERSARHYGVSGNIECVKGYLMDTCLPSQDNFKIILDYFCIKYGN